MKNLLITLLLAVFVGPAFAQDLNENFQHDGSLPDGWTVYSSSTTYQWAVVKYSTFSRYYTGFNGGDTYAMRSRTGRITSTRPAPESWLITPAVTVPENGVLNFMMVTDGSFNILETTPEESRSHFSVLVSEEGTDTTTFTNELLNVVPLGVDVWKSYSLDLSQWAGKTIHIAFHDYGNTSGKAYTTNSIYLDNVSVDTRRGSDVYVSEVVSPQSGYSSRQPLTVKVHNNGFDVDGVSVGYSIDGVEGTAATLDATLARDSEVSYTFPDTLDLTDGQSHALKVWAYTEADLNHDNDSLSASVDIDRHLSFPYTMNDSTAATDWQSTYIYERLGTSYGWSYVDDSTQNVHAWSYITPPASTSELVSGWIPFPEGKVGFEMSYKSLSSGTLTLQLLDTASVTLASETIEFPSADDYTTRQVVFNMPQAKDCRAVLFLTGDYTTQLLVNGLSFFTPLPSDVNPVVFVSPELSAYVSGDSIPVTATLSNIGSGAAQDVAVSLLVDGQTVQTDTIAAIASGETLDHTFASKLLIDEGSHQLAVVADSDSITKDIFVYQPQAYPYQETFEDTTTWASWTQLNPASDPVYWTITGVVKGNVNYAKNGTHAAYIGSASNIEHDDWLISPAINVTATGRQRLSFFYVTTYKSASSKNKSVLDVYVGQTNRPDSLVKLPLVTTDTITNDNLNVYRQGFATLDISEPGLYYIAFHNTGKGHDIILDDVRLDNSADLAIVSATHTATDGFHLSGDTISLLLQNRGATDISGLTLKGLCNDSVVTTQAANALLQPGDTIRLNLSDGFDLSTPGIYNIGAEVAADGDVEAFNDRWAFASVECFADATLPYTENLDSTRHQSQWTLQGNWRTGTYSSANAAYNGTGAISHHGAAVGDADWAYSGCIYIPAGTYEMSFFYRTFLNGTNMNNYGQDFAVYLGTACNPSAMTIPVYETDEPIVAPDKRYRKVLSTIEIPEDGEYYIGIECSSTAVSGVLYLDAFAINAPAEPQSVKSYQADFAERGDEWYHYDPSSQFQQWKASETDPQSLVVRQSVQKDLMPTDLPGLLVSPAFELEEGDAVTVSLGYNISIDHPELYADSTLEGISMAVLTSSVDLPEGFTNLLLRSNNVSGDDQTVTATFDIEQTGTYYFGILPYGADHTTSGEAITTYTLNAFSFDAVSTGMKETLQSDGPCQLYQLDGVLLGTFNNESEALKGQKQGIYLIKNDATVRKVLVK